jgi:hypothetical protein
VSCRGSAFLKAAPLSERVSLQTLQELDVSERVEETARESPGKKADIRLPRKGNSNSHGARPVHHIILMIR